MSHIFAVNFQLVIFNDDLSMQRVQLEGLVAYRSDVKQLYFRDTFSWRVIRVGFAIFCIELYLIPVFNAILRYFVCGRLTV